MEAIKRNASSLPGKGIVVNEILRQKDQIFRKTKNEMAWVTTGSLDYSREKEW
jgi:hypothetical protein